MAFDDSDFATELVLRLTKFYQDGMVEAGLTKSQIMAVSLYVMQQQVEDLNTRAEN